jgi:hypothetical protein
VSSQSCPPPSPTSSRPSQRPTAQRTTIVAWLQLRHRRTATGCNRHQQQMRLLPLPLSCSPHPAVCKAFLSTASWFQLPHCPSQQRCSQQRVRQLASPSPLPSLQSQPSPPAACAVSLSPCWSSCCASSLYATSCCSSIICRTLSLDIAGQRPPSPSLFLYPVRTCHASLAC